MHYHNTLAVHGVLAYPGQTRKQMHPQCGGDLHGISNLLITDMLEQVRSIFCADHLENVLGNFCTVMWVMDLIIQKQTLYS